MDYLGSFNFLLIIFITWAIYYYILGPKRKPGQDQHPYFKSYTIYVPNIMSFIRFPLGAWIFSVHYFEIFHNSFGFISLHLSFAIVALFDFLDGKFARKWNAITEEGKSLDPASDKVVTFFLALTAFVYGDLQDRWWVLAILVIREVGSMIQRMKMKKKGIDVSAKWLGKVKTVLQFAILYLLILRIDILPGSILVNDWIKLLPEGFILWFIILLCFITVISFFPFFNTFYYVNNYTKSQREESNQAWYIVIIPNLFTVGNYLCGVTAVYFSIPEVEVGYRPFVILFWVCAAAMFDAFDGPLARKLNSHSDFGACLDSSTDLSTFGLAVGTSIFLQFSALENHFSYWGLIVAIIYFCFVHLRLARFTEILESSTDKGKKTDFLGLPSPAGAFAALLMFTFTESVAILSVLLLWISWLMFSQMKFLSHSNTFKLKYYRFFLIPVLIIGFAMLFILIFQQPFVTNLTSRELVDYFHICSYVLLFTLVMYFFDAFYHTYLGSNNDSKK